MKYLKEQEAGFDGERLGFPSISGCLAICYVTDGGIFGYHNNGNSGKEQWAVRAGLFSNYVNHRGAGAGAHLYGSCFLSNNARGYRMDKSPVEGLKGELKKFAELLGFKGQISYCDLASTLAGSAYVEFRHTGKTCIGLAQTWTDAGKAETPNPNSPDQQALAGRQYSNVIASVDKSTLQTLTMLSLRS